MTLLADMQEALKNEAGLAAWEVFDFISDADMVSDEYVDSGRWSEHWTAVFSRGYEFVALDYEKPATEMQEGGDFYSEVYPVKPVEVKTVKYEKIR